MSAIRGTYVAYVEASHQKGSCGTLNVLLCFGCAVQRVKEGGTLTTGKSWFPASNKPMESSTCGRCRQWGAIYPVSAAQLQYLRETSEHRGNAW